jgi:hypothetical protein
VTIRREVFKYPSRVVPGDMVFAKVPRQAGESITIPNGWTFQGHHIDNGQPYSIYYRTIAAGDNDSVTFEFTAEEEESERTEFY